jgi:hypothetical protein
VQTSFVSICYAQTETDTIRIATKQDKLEFNLEIPLWIPGFKGSFSIGDITIEGEGQNEDILSKLFDSDIQLEYYFVGSLGVAKNKWQIQGDIFGGRLNDAIEFKHRQNQLVDVTIFSIMPRVFGSYKLFELDFKRKRALISKHLEIWGYGGFRYVHLNIYTETNTILPAFDITKNWLDPIIGFTVPLTINRFILVFQNDIGGFGLGSDFTYWYQLYGIWQVGKYISLEAGWVHLNINYSEEKQINSFIYKATMRGPMAGVMFTF